MPLPENNRSQRRASISAVDPVEQCRVADLPDDRDGEPVATGTAVTAGGGGRAVRPGGTVGRVGAGTGLAADTSGARPAWPCLGTRRSDDEFAHGPLDAGPPGLRDEGHDR